MRPLQEIQARLKSLSGDLTQADVAKRLKISQSAVSNLAGGTRHLRYAEALTLMQMLWPEDPYGEGDKEVDGRVSAEWKIAVEALLAVQGMHPADLELVLEIVPAIREEMKSAELIGDDPIVAARTAARLFWKPTSRKERAA